MNAELVKLLLVQSMADSSVTYRTSYPGYVVDEKELIKNTLDYCLDVVRYKFPEAHELLMKEFGYTV